MVAAAYGSTVASRALDLDCHCNAHAPGHVFVLQFKTPMRCFTMPMRQCEHALVLCRLQIGRCSHLCC